MRQSPALFTGSAPVCRMAFNQASNMIAGETHLGPFLRGSLAKDTGALFPDDFVRAGEQFRSSACDACDICHNCHGRHRPGNSCDAAFPPLTRTCTHKPDVSPLCPYSNQVRAAAQYVAMGQLGTSAHLQTSIRVGQPDVCLDPVYNR
jgi:hypothetical protein